MQGEDKPVKIPQGATHRDESGIWYKKGSHGFNYYWDKHSRSWERSHRELKQSERLVFYEN